VLVIEGLSRLFIDAKRRGFKISLTQFITHMHFVDDVILFGNGSYVEWKEIHRLIQLCCEASGMEINANKSRFLRNGVDEGIFAHTIIFFPFKVELWDMGIKYLG